jgi:hypothetical protein
LKGYYPSVWKTLELETTDNETIALITKMADGIPWTSPSGQILSKNAFSYACLTERQGARVDDQVWQAWKNWTIQFLISDYSIFTVSKQEQRMS